MLSFRKSFFSGHASFAMYTMLYLAVSPAFLSIEPHKQEKHLRSHLMFVLDHFTPAGVMEPIPAAYGRRRGTPLDESPAPSIGGFW